MSKKTLAALGLSFLLLTACGNTQENTSTADIEQTAAKITPASAPDSQAIQKIDQLFSLSATQQDAKNRALSTCMAGKGFIYTPAQPTASFSIRSLISPAPLTLEQARARGYTDPQTQHKNTTSGLEAPGATEAFMGSADAKTISVEGIPGGIKEDGCLAAAYQQLFGNIEVGIFFEGGTLNLPLPYINAAMEDPQVAQLDQEWSTCMTENHQISLDTPSLIFKQPNLMTLETAVADAQCREKINYENRLTSITNGYLTAFLNDQQNLIQQITDAKKTAEINAPKILSQ